MAGAAAVSVGDVVAVVLNVTATEPDGAGYLTVWAPGTPQPLASVLNPEHAGHTIANLVTSAVADGHVLVSSLTGTHLVVDVQGVYVAAGSARAGRLVPIAPGRVLDTRTTGSAWGAGEVRAVSLLAHGVPATATAAVVNVTAVEPAGAGYLTAFPAGTTPPLVSNLNVNAAGETVANQAITPLSNGETNLFASVATHVVVDVTGYFTGSSAPSSGDGLFVPLTPRRVLDTREMFRQEAGTAFAVGTAGTAGLPGTGVGAVAFNVTLTQPGAPGHVTVWPAGTAAPSTSSVNATRPGQTVANHTITQITGAGWAMYTHASAHVIADLTGYWTGTPAPQTETPPPPPRRGPSAPPATGPHTFLDVPGYDVLPNGPFRWDPCRPLRYMTDLTAATPAQVAALQHAISRAEAATGIDFVHAGEIRATADDLNAQQPGDTYDAILGVYSREHTPVDWPPGIAGWGGFSSADWPTMRIKRGFALIGNWLTSPADARQMWLHEIGHMLGLGHVDDAGQVMQPVYGTPHDDYGPGDLEGLWRLGAAQGCLN